MIIQTGRNRVIVDDGFKTPPGTWVVVKGAYACLRSYDKDTGQCRAVYLHRHITSAPRGKYVDHINRNPLDNRSRNLRVVNCLESAKNRAGRGYSWSERDGKFSVNAQLGRKKYHGGMYAKESDAKIAAKVLWSLLYGKMRHAP